MERGLRRGRWALGVTLLVTATACTSLATQRGISMDPVQVALVDATRPATPAPDASGTRDDRGADTTVAPSFDAELPIPQITSQVTSPVARPPERIPDAAEPPDHEAIRPSNSEPVARGRAHRPVEAPRLVLVGDSISAQLCPLFAGAPCFAYPGAWVADAQGVNLADQFVTEAQIGPNDTVVLSSIGGWHSPGVDDSVILARLDALYQRVSRLAHKVIVLVAPEPNFPLCVNPTTDAARALLGDRHEELCTTQAAVAELERTWPTTVIAIDGPYIDDQEHPSSAGLQSLVAQINDAR